MALYRAAIDPNIPRTGPARLVLVLYDHRNRKTGQCNPGNARLAGLTVLKDASSVRRARRACERAGILKTNATRRRGTQSSNQYDLLDASLTELVRRVADSLLAVYASMLGRVVWKTGTVEATPRDLAADSGVAIGRVDVHLRELERLG